MRTWLQILKVTWSSSSWRWVITILSHIYSRKCYSTCLSISRATSKLATYLLWAYWLHKRSFFIIQATKGLNNRKPSYCRRYSLLSIIPVTEGLSSRKPSYCWRYSFLSIIPTTKGLNDREPSYCWRYSLVSIIPATEGISSRKPSYRWGYSLLSIIPITKDLNGRNPSYRWGSSLLSIIIKQSNKKGSNRQQPFLPLDMFISLAAKGLSNRLPFFGCTITRRFNIRGLY